MKNKKKLSNEGKKLLSAQPNVELYLLKNYWKSCLQYACSLSSVPRSLILMLVGKSSRVEPDQISLDWSHIE